MSENQETLGERVIWLDAILYQEECESGCHRD